MSETALTLRLPDDLRDRAAAEAVRLGESLATWIRAAIREKLERDR